MSFLCKLREEGPGQGVPVAKPPGIAHVVRQQVQHLYILRRRRQQLGVIVHRRVNEGIVLRRFAVPVLPGDEQPFYPKVPDAAGVAGQVHPAGDIRRAAQTRAQGAELALRKLRGLVHENPVIFLALVLVVIARSIMSKLDRGTVGEEKHMHGAVIDRNLLRDQLSHGQNHGLLQLRVFPPHNQNPDSRIGQRTAKGFDSQHVALSAASCPAIAHIPGSGLTKELLFGIQFSQVHGNHPAVVSVFSSHALTSSEIGERPPCGGPYAYS